jgi:hypothetical protein
MCCFMSCKLETSFLFKLFTRVKHIGHCQEALRQKWLWIIVVLPWVCLTIVGETYIHVNNLWKWVWFIIFNRIRNDCIYSMTKRWCSSLIVGVSVDYSNFEIGWKKKSQHLSFICAFKLHIQIVALWCYLAMVLKVCIHFLFQNMVNNWSLYTCSKSWFANGFTHIVWDGANMAMGVI